MNMDVATAIMSIRVSTDQCLMAGKMILHKFKSQGLCFLASKMVFVFIARIKTDDIVMGLDFVVSVVFSILVIEHFALKIKGVGIAVYSIHVKFAAEHHLLNNDCDTSIDKSRKFLSELTNGKLNISKGMISRLGHEFTRKTEEERKETFKDMLLTPVMHTDCTNARYNGKSAYVFICADPEGNALYFARERKGLEGVKGTVTEDYQGTLVHDHELTFFNFGSEHQECLAHVLRYLKDSMENEPDRTWNREMHALVTEMIHYRNETALHAEPDPVQISAFEARYDEILKKATDEYEYVLPSKYYRDGYNLYRRMEKFKRAHLRFLYDHTIPTTNNAAERHLRNYKRKQKQAISFRSFASIEDLCNGKSVLIKIRNNDGANVFQEVAQRFDS